ATPAQSYDELEWRVRNAEMVLHRLELPYRVVERCVGDLGFSAAKGYDIEVWLPGQNRYREISSCSNYDAFGGRRAEIRYRPESGGRPALSATLKSSGPAGGRPGGAVLGRYQEAARTRAAPPALRSRTDGGPRLTPPPPSRHTPR